MYAAILRVQVGGMNYYNGVPKPKPLLGEPLQAIAPVHIYQALQLTRWCFLLWLGGAIACLTIVDEFSTPNVSFRNIAIVAHTFRNLECRKTSFPYNP